MTGIPGETDWNALYGVGSPVYQRERDASWQSTMHFYDQFNQQIAARQGRGQQEIPSASIVQQAQPAHAGWSDEDLVGAGMFWGLPEEAARGMPRQAVIDYVNSKRGAAGKEGVSFAAEALAPLAMFGLGAGEAVTSTLQHLPGIGDWLSRQKIVHEADSKLRQLEEGVRASIPGQLPNEGQAGFGTNQGWQQNLASAANIAGNLGAMYYPGTAAWALAGRLTNVMPLVSRLSPIGRAAVAGGMDVAKALNMAGGAANPLTRTAVQGGIAAYGLMGGTRDEDLDPWTHRAAVFGGGAVLATAMKVAEPALIHLATRVTKFFVPDDLVKSVAPPEPTIESGIPTGPGPFQAEQFAGETPPSNVMQLRALAQNGNAQAQSMLDYMRGGSMEIPTGGPNPVRAVDNGIPSDMGGGLPEVGYGRGPTNTPLAGLRQEDTSFLPEIGRAPEISPFAPAPGGSGAGTPFQDWTPQVGYGRGATNTPVKGLMEEIDGAQSLASQMNKAATIVQSPDFPAIAGQTQIDDLSVIQAAHSENPGGTNITQGISNPEKIIQNLGSNARFAMRNGRLDVLTADRPISEAAVKEYETHGVFTGQKVITGDGLGGMVRGIVNGEVLVEPKYAGSIMLRPVGSVHPWLTSPQVEEAPALWNQFQQYANQRAVETQAAMGGALGPDQVITVKSKNLANWMDTFLDGTGITHPADRARVGEYFNQRWVDSFKDLAPVETAVQQSATAELNQAVGEAQPSPVKSLDTHAATKGYVVIPVNEGEWHLQNVVPHSGGSPASRVSFTSREAAETWVKQFNRELPDITPPADVPLELTAVHPTEPAQAPNLNEQTPQATVNSVREMEADSEGGSGELPPHEVLAAEGNSGRLNNRWIQSFLRWRPARRLMSALDEGLNQHTGQDVGLAKDYYDISTQLVRHHNDQNPWMDELTDILKPVRSKFLNDGTWTRVYEITDPAQRAQTAVERGFLPRELATLDQFDNLMQRLFPETGLDEVRQIPRYISHIAQRQSQPDMLGKEFEDFPLGPTTAPFYEQARTGNLNFRELHPGVLGETYIRAVTWTKNMKPMYDGMVEKYNTLARDGDEATKQVAEIMKQQLKIIRYGYSAADDTALDMLHGSLQAIMGPEVTRQQAKEMFNFGLNSVHSAMLGFRTSTIARDIFQSFLAIPRAGSDLLRVYSRWMSDPAARKAIWDEAVAEGAVSLQMPRSASPGAFMGELEHVAGLPEGGVAPGQSEYGWRMQGAAKVTGAIRDMMPEWLRDTRDSPFHAMYLYGKQSELTRALVYTAGKEKAARALETFRAAGENASLDQLMGESAARTFDPSWQRQFQSMVASGDDLGAAKFLGHQLADATQFKYGVFESPWVAKSMTGRLAMQFGNYPMQYFQFLRESLTNGTVADKAKLVTLVGATFAGVNAASEKTGWNFRWMNPFMGLGFTGGPMISTLNDMAQGARAAFSAPTADDPNYSQMQAGISAAGQAVGNMLPVAGLWKTAQGVGQGLDSPHPAQAVLRHLVTGQTGAGPDINNDLYPQAQQSFQSSLQPYQSPVRGGGSVGLPAGYFPQQPVIDPALIQDPRQIPASVQTSGSTPQSNAFGVSAGGLQPAVPPQDTSEISFAPQQRGVSSAYSYNDVLQAFRGDQQARRFMTQDEVAVLDQLSGLPTEIAIPQFRQYMAQKLNRR